MCLKNSNAESCNNSQFSQSLDDSAQGVQHGSTLSSTKVAATPLVIASVVIEMILAVQTLGLSWYRAKPGGACYVHVLPELLRHSLNLHACQQAGFR
jgi:hypothetical protein